MTENQKPNHADKRRAGVLTLHHRRGDTEGLLVIAEETNAENRVPQLVHAVLLLHQVLIGLLRTQSGVNLLGDWVVGLTTREASKPSEVDIVRAAQILNYHGKGDKQGIAEVMNAATAAGRPTEVLLQLLSIFEVALPELSGPFGLEWLAVQIEGLVEKENTPDEG
jgi:hypothetical protein